jgi:hypothetical protein
VKYSSAVDRVAEVRRLAEDRKDYEAAHGVEDELWMRVLEAIRDGAENPSELARIALKTGEIDYPRWYA